MPCSATRCRGATPTSTPTRGGPGGRVWIGRGVVRAGRREAGYGGFTAVVTGLVSAGADHLPAGVRGLLNAVAREGGIDVQYTIALLRDALGATAGAVPSGGNRHRAPPAQSTGAGSRPALDRAVLLSGGPGQRDLELGR